MVCLADMYAHMKTNMNTVCLGFTEFCRQKCHFLFVKKCKFRQKFCYKSRNLSLFRHPKIRRFQQCITVAAVNLFCEVLSKQFRDFWLPLFFSFVKTCKLCQKGCHKSKILPFFCHPKSSACYKLKQPSKDFVDKMLFLRAKAAMLSARLSHRNSVRLSVCLSHGWIRQKRFKLGSPNLHHWLPGRL